MRHAITRDLARQTGVSVAAGSRLLYGTARVPDHTRRRIRDATRQRRYQPQSATRGPSLRRTRVLGVILPDPHGEFFSIAAAVLAPNDAMVVGAMSAFREHGMRVPDDVSAAGCDDIAIGRFVTLPLSTVRGRADAERPPPGGARREPLPRSW